MTEQHDGSWSEYKRAILYRLDHIERTLVRLEEKVDSVHTSVTVLKVKAGVIGGVTAALVTLASALASKYL